MHSENYNIDATNFKKDKVEFSVKEQGYMSIFPKTVKYANAYVPFQESKTLFELEESLSKGTIFAELYQPYKKGCDIHYGKK